LLFLLFGNMILTLTNDFLWKKWLLLAILGGGTKWNRWIFHNRFQAPAGSQNIKRFLIYCTFISDL
jgi:hypothetical protein